MGKIAFVFSGQGAQYPGMGESLCQESAAARAVFEMADAIRPGTSEQCFHGTKEDLTSTQNTQPDMFAVELAAAAALEEAGVQPSCLAGFSLGEISALAFSGAVSREDGFRLVCRRGELMADAAAQVEAGMVAVVKLPPQKVEELCQGFEQVYPVNYNSPAQTVVSGRADQMEPFKAAVKAAGGRALPLAVKGGFHSPFMAPAAAGLREVLSAMEIGEPRFTLYSNVTGQPYQGEMKDLLARQVENPVRWQATVEHMIASGVDTFIEVGPGKTLCGLISKIDSGVKVLNVEDAESLAKTIEEVTATC